MSTSRVVDFDLGRCAICGGPNQCAMAQVPEADECWCETATIPPELLARVPANVAGRVCVCQRCVAEHNKTNSR